MKVTVQKILKSEQKTSKSTGKLYTLTSFMGADGEFYENVYGKRTEGEEIEGEWTTDNYGNKKFEVAKTAPGGFQRGGKSPEELEQNLKLAIAQNQSIQRQVATKCVVELIVAGKREWSDLQSTYDELMKLVSPAQAKKPAEDFDAAVTALGAEEVPYE